MHLSAWLSARVFFTLIASLSENRNVIFLENSVEDKISSSQLSKKLFSIADIGSQDINGNMKTALYDSILPNVVDVNYIGLDFAAGSNVDVVISPKAKAYPFLPDSVDIVISSSALEHDPRFWTSFLRMLMVLKPGGFLYISVPFETIEHRYPIDCWRFNGNAGNALESWGKDNDYDISLVFAEILEPFGNIPARDNVMVFYKKTESDDDEESVQIIKNHFATFMNTYLAQTKDLEVIISCLKSVVTPIPSDGVWSVFRDVSGAEYKLTTDFEILPV